MNLKSKLNPKLSLFHLSERFRRVDESPVGETAQKLRDARKSVVSSFISLADAEKTLNEDETLNPAQKTLELSKLAKSKQAWIFDKTTRVEIEALKALGEHGKKIDALYQTSDRLEEDRNREIRQKLLGMEYGERIEYVRDCLMSKDEAVLKAIASVSGDLSGCLPMHHTEARMLLAEIKEPQAFTAIQQITAELENIRADAASFELEVEKEYIKPAKHFQHMQEESKKALSENHEESTNV